MYEDINVYRIRGITGYRDSLFKKILRYINFMILGTIIAIFIVKNMIAFWMEWGALTDMLPAIIIHKVYKTNNVMGARCMA